MSGRELVRARRDSEPPPDPAGGAGILDLAIIFVVVIAVGSVGYLGYTRWLSPRAPAPGPAAAKLIAVAQPDVAWTDADTARCKGKAQAAVDSPETGDDGALADRTVAEGFAGMATFLECRITTKIARFCDPKEKSALVDMVNDYLGRIDLLKFGLGVQGAPMAILGGTMGGEIAAGRDMYNMEKDATFSVMDTYHKRVAAGLKALGRRGIVTAADFGSFAGVPAVITDVFKDVTVSDQLCA